MIKVLVAGDRRWNDLELIKESLRHLYGQDDKIVLAVPLTFPIGKAAADEMKFQCELIDNVSDPENFDYLGSINMAVLFHKYIRNSTNCKAITRECASRKIPWQVVGSSF